MSRYGGRGTRPMNSNAKPSRPKKTWSPTEKKTRRSTNEHAKAKTLVSLRTLGHAVRDAAAAAVTHFLTCGVRDRESHEIKYLREATDLIETLQQQLQDGQSVSRPPSEHNEVILIERER